MEKQTMKALCIVETKEEKQISDAELKKKCFNYARDYFQGKVFTNKATKRAIKVSHDGLGEWKIKSKTRNQILSIKILDKLLKNAAFDHDSPDKIKRLNVENFSYFTQQCVINETLYTAVITIKRTKPSGDKYYHHYLEDIRIEPRSGSAPTPAS